MTGTMGSPASRRPSSILHSAFCILHFFVALLSPSCASWDGHLNVLGYSTKPNYDLRYKTISVPVFRNRTYWVVTPNPGMEVDLTRAVVREIQMKTPYKVTQNDADTELIGTISNFQKNLINYTPFNTVREAETILTAELIWRDRRTGEILTRSTRRLGEALEPETKQPMFSRPDSVFPPGTTPRNTPSTPTAPTSGVIAEGEEVVLDPVTKKKAKPVVVRSVAYFRPELGESITTALQKNIDRLAVQIVSAMENGW